MIAHKIQIIASENELRARDVKYTIMFESMVLIHEDQQLRQICIPDKTFHQVDELSHASKSTAAGSIMRIT